MQGQDLEAALGSLPEAGGGLQQAHQAGDLRCTRHEDENGLGIRAHRAHLRSICPVLQCTALCLTGLHASKVRTYGRATPCFGPMLVAKQQNM